tara:strand:+ start:302 stop:478 length:177 start_codon:yes stop_codon:yes gene_type:complete
MKKKEKYISAFLDGYFAHCVRSNSFGMSYYYVLEFATEQAEKKWKQYKKNKKLGKINS